MDSHPISPALEDRERTILRCAQEILATRNDLHIRIADVARRSDISVGTFYTHFQSKEDLILGLVAEAASMRRQQFEDSFQDPQLHDMGRIIVGMLRNFLFGYRNPGLHAAEELASTRAIWDGATEARAKTVREELEKLSFTFRGQVMKAIESGHLKPWDNPSEQASRVDKAAWFLMAGCNQVYRSQLNREPLNIESRTLPAPILASLQAILLGFGWVCDQPEREVEHFAQIALTCLD